LAGFETILCGCPAEGEPAGKFTACATEAASEQLSKITRHGNNIRFISPPRIAAILAVSKAKIKKIRIAASVDLSVIFQIF
jgi:hypothetical protein